MRPSDAFAAARSPRSGATTPSGGWAATRSRRGWIAPSPRARRRPAAPARRHVAAGSCRRRAAAPLDRARRAAGPAPVDVRLAVPATAERPLLIGRGRECDLSCATSAVSAATRSCVAWTGAGCARRRSTNGTWDGAWRVDETEVDAGSELRLGWLLVRFRSAPASGPVGAIGACDVGARPQRAARAACIARGPEPAVAPTLRTLPGTQPAARRPERAASLVPGRAEARGGACRWRSARRPGAGRQRRTGHRRRVRTVPRGTRRAAGSAGRCAVQPAAARAPRSGANAVNAATGGTMHGCDTRRSRLRSFAFAGAERRPAALAGADDGRPARCRTERAGGVPLPGLRRVKSPLTGRAVEVVAGEGAAMVVVPRRRRPTARTERPPLIGRGRACRPRCADRDGLPPPRGLVRDGVGDADLALSRRRLDERHVGRCAEASPRPRSDVGQRSLRQPARAPPHRGPFRRAGRA